MYEIIGRERVSINRLSRFTVRFSMKWPRGTRRIYIISTFTSLFPGRFELARSRDRGVLTLNVWDGLYPYWFSLDGRTLDLDMENVEKFRFKLADADTELEASLAKVGVEEYREAIEGRRDWRDLIVHDERSPVFISRLGSYTIIRLWAPKGVINEALIEYRNTSGINKEEAMTLIGRDEFKDYYEVWIKDTIIGYVFKLRDGRNVFSFGINGLGDLKPIIPRGFSGPKIMPWWIGAIYYMIFVDSFNNVLEKNIEYIKILEPREPGYYGGDLEGIAQKVDYIKSLGVNAIYLTPIYKSASYHRYDVIDHFSIDPMIGGEKSFKQLLEKLRREDLKLVLDIVAHHTSLCHGDFIRLLKGSPNRMYKLLKPVRNVEEEILKELRSIISGGCRSKLTPPPSTKSFYESFANTWHMPKLDHEKLYVRDYIKKLLKHWLEAGADGFRFDVGHAIPDSAMKEYYEYIKSLREDTIVISEVTVGIDSYPLGVTMDSATNYDLREYIIKFFITKEINAESLAGFLARQYSRIPPYSSLSLINLLGSHDTPRIKTVASKCYPECVMRMYSLIFIMPGAPAIYYGDEVGIEGGKDPDCRRPMIWDPAKWDRRLLEHIRRLANLRNKIRPLKYGGLHVYAVNNDTIAIQRSYMRERVLGLITRDDVIKARIENIGEVFIGLRGESVMSENGMILLTLKEHP